MRRLHEVVEGVRALGLAPRDELAGLVRALLVDKDRRPRWEAHGEAETAALVAAAMAPLPSGELDLDWRQP